MAFSVKSIAAAKRRRAQTPANPPPGTYDPTIDATGRNNQRSYDDTLQNFAIGSQRAKDDLGIALGNIGTSQQNSLSDLSTGHDRSLADLLSGRDRNAADHQTALADLARNYSMLADKQGQAARQANVESGGILAQALAKRQANQAHDQAPIDTAFNRSLADSTTAEQRIGQDYATNTGRVNQGATNQSDAVKLAFDRAYGANGDQALNVSRAGRNLVAGNLDLSNQRWYQAAAMGYSPVQQRRRKQVIV